MTLEKLLDLAFAGCLYRAQQEPQPLSPAKQIEYQCLILEIGEHRKILRKLEEEAKKLRESE